MTTSLNAWGFAAKGHYYQLADVVSSSKPVIRDSNGKEIAADPDGDDTFLGVEPTTGVCLQALERIFFNMQIFGDDLFRNFSPPIPEEHGYFFPLAYVKRESAWTQNQVDEVFGALVLGQKIKLALCIIMLVIGAILLGLGGFYGWKLHKERKELNEMEPESTVPKVDTVDPYAFGQSTTDRQRRRDVDGSVNSEEGLFNSQVKKDKKKKSKKDKNDSDSDDFRDFRESKKQGKPLLSKEY